MTVRFWITHRGGWVKLALSDSRPAITHSAGGRTADGWKWEHQTYTLCRDKEGSIMVRRRWARDWRDRDGRWLLQDSLICPLGALHGRTVYTDDGDTILVPAWCPVYDETGRALNY